MKIQKMVDMVPFLIIILYYSIPQRLLLGNREHWIMLQGPGVIQPPATSGPQRSSPRGSCVEA